MPRSGEGRWWVLTSKYHDPRGDGGRGRRDIQVPRPSYPSTTTRPEKDASRRRERFWRRAYPDVTDEDLAAAVAEVDRALKRKPS